MASDQQLSLARVQRGASTHLNRAARRVIPQFLQKLYEIVNDSENSSLIKWSDAGDSFFVLDHERFAREVLGRWFKHQKFPSFVRQLNMYGFHKIPHLQQGVLRSDTDTELWNFEHPNFHRGQPDMLCLIQRKKQMTQASDDAPPAKDNVSVTTPHFLATSPPPPATTLSAGQILDISSIVNGISAIKRHQTAISADLNELKNSNQLLWQEALAAREKHKKHQDTINRILKFLAGVFGNSATMHKGDAVNHNPVVPRNSQRLMIEHDPSRQGKGVGIVEIEDEEMGLPLPLSNQFVNAETPSSIASPAPELGIPASPEAAVAISSLPSTSLFTPAESPTETHPTPSTPSTELPSPAPPIDQQQQQQPSAVSLTTTPNASNSDAMMQAAFAELLSSPGQMHRILAALNAQQTYQIPEPIPLPGVEQPSSFQSQLTSYDPLLEFSHVDPIFNRTPLDPATSALLSPSPPTLTSSSDALAPYEPIADHTNRLHKTYKDAHEINQEVDVIHATLSSLIEGMGLDPNLMNHPLTTAPSHEDHGSLLADPSSAMPATESQHATNGSGGDSGAVDFDLDFGAFLNELSTNSHATATDTADFTDQMESTSFLDEIHSASDGTLSPISLRHHSPISSSNDKISVPARPTGNNRKRKSNVAQLDDQKSSTIQINSEVKAKRRR